MKSLKQIELECKDIANSLKKLREPRNIFSSIKAKDRLYNVCWYVGGVKKETLAYNVKKSTALGIKNSKSTTTHKCGIIILEPQG